MVVTLTLSLHIYAIGFAYDFTWINISPKFDKDLSNNSGELEMTRTCYGQMDRWVDELIDRWAEDVHFHNPLSKLQMGLERHSEAVQTVF